MTGIKRSAETRRKISEVQKGKKVPNKKGSLIIDNQGNTFVSVSAAARFHKMTIGQAFRLLQTGSHRKFTVRFSNKEET